MPMMVNKLIFTIVPTQAPFLIRPLVSAIFGSLTSKLVDPEITKTFDFIGEEMDKLPTPAQGSIKWLAGGDKTGGPVRDSGRVWLLFLSSHFALLLTLVSHSRALLPLTLAQTAADYQMLFPFELAAASGRVSNCPASVRAWVDAVHARPAYQRALDKGGKYQYC